jgi:hypothetical protein
VGALCDHLAYGSNKAFVFADRAFKRVTMCRNVHYLFIIITNDGMVMPSPFNAEYGTVTKHQEVQA